MRILLSARSGPARLIAALALLAVLLGAVAAGQPLGAAAGLFATSEDDGGRWLVERDESKPAKIEVDQRAVADKGALGSAAPRPAALAQAATERVQPRAGQRAARPAPADPPPEPPAHRRPDPTGPPLLG